MKLGTEQIVHLFHVLIIGTLFLYVGLRRDKIPPFLFPVWLALGVVVIVYHLFKIYLKARKGEGYWVNLIHIFIVGPLLVYIGYNKENTARLYFELLLMLGFASIGYHGYYLFQN